MPTADLNTTAGMAIGVFFLIQYFGVKHKGLGTFVGEFFTAPFHSNNISATIGGPIIPHHQFFFFFGIEPSASFS